MLYWHRGRFSSREWIAEGLIHLRCGKSKISFLVRVSSVTFEAVSAGQRGLFRFASASQSWATERLIVHV